MLKIEPLALTRELFAPYGDVIETDGADHFDINAGMATRFHDLAKVQTLGENARTLVSIFHGQGISLPKEIKMFERHPLGSQAFIPLNERPFLVIVAADEDGVPTSPAAFIASKNQGVNYHANVWHHPLIPLDQSAEFLVVDRGGDGDNLEEYFIEQPYMVEPI